MKKWDWKKTDQPYFKIAVYVFAVLAATVLFEKVVGNLPSISSTIQAFLKVTQTLCLPFLMGFMIAYVMNPFINFFERHTIKNNSFFQRHPRVTRAVAITLIYTLVIGGIIWIAIYLVPEIKTSIVSFAKQLPVYTATLNQKIEDLFMQVDFIDGEDVNNIINRLLTPVLGVSENLQAGSGELAFLQDSDGISKMLTTFIGNVFTMGRFVFNLIMAIFIFGMKILRVDMSKLKAVDPEMIAEQMPLPPMNLRQKIYLLMVPIFLVMMLVPSFFPDFLICQALNFIGPMGIALIWVILFLIVRIDGKPLLDFKEVAYRQFNWGIFFMIAAAVYGANTLSDEATGIPDFLIQALTPVLGGRSEMVFVAIMFTFALILTNFANNAAMAVILMPVVLNFSNELGINPMPVATGVILMVFVAMLTPAASPHAGMMHGMRSIYNTKDILRIGFPMCLLALVLYIFIGYPLAKMMMVG